MPDTESTMVAARYRLVRILGEGGMGRVWAAHDELLHREVALKQLLLPAGLTHGEITELRERAIREARSVAQFDHPNVIRIFDVVHEQDSPWIVMELVESRSMHQVLRDEGPMSPAKAARKDY